MVKGQHPPQLQIVRQSCILYNNIMQIKRGFTIVELLIVIVIIAILAAIIIVTYNGITDRAVTASMQNDLSAAAKKMELARIDNNDSYPTSFPAGTAVSGTNVLQMTSVANPAKAYCINAYGRGNKVASISNTSGLQAYLCTGATIGTAIGGTAPTAPRGTNLLASGFSTWTTSGGMSYNAGTGEMVCNNVSYGAAYSPLIRVDSAANGTFKYDGYATVASSTRTYSGVWASSSYWAADGTTAVYNTDPSPGPYQGNGNAPLLAAPLSTWQNVGWTMTLGPSVIYVRLALQCDAQSSHYTSDTHYRNPTYTVQ